MRLIIFPCPKRAAPNASAQEVSLRDLASNSRVARSRTAPGKAGIGSLMLAALLWAVVMVLGVWDYYILKFPPCNLPRIYQEVLMPVVKVRAGASTGSGVILSDKHILTAAHVVKNESTVTIYIYDYERVFLLRTTKI